MDLEKIETKNDCAGEGQEQFNRQTEIEYYQVSRQPELLAAMRYYVTVNSREHQK
jgi:hypothetical protein